MPLNLPKYPITKLSDNTPANEDNFNKPHSDSDENFDYLKTNLEKITDILSVDGSGKATFANDLEVVGKIGGSESADKSYLQAERIYPHDMLTGSPLSYAYPADFTQSPDGQWTWNNEPTVTTGRHYFYNPNGAWQKDETILNPAIGEHLGEIVQNFRSLKKLDHSANDGRPVYEVSGYDNIRLVGKTSTPGNGSIYNAISGVGIYHGGQGKMELQVIGYFNHFHLLTIEQSTRNDTATVDINGVRTSGTLTNTHTAPSVNGSRYLPENTPLFLEGNPSITLGVNTLTINKDLAVTYGVFTNLGGIKLLVNATTIKRPAQKAVVQGKEVSIPADTAVTLVDSADSSDEGYTEVWDHASDPEPFNGGRIVTYLDTDSVVKRKVNWMPPNAKYQETFSWATGTSVGLSSPVRSPAVTKIGSTFHCFWDDNVADILYSTTTTPGTWNAGTKVIGPNANGGSPIAGTHYEGTNDTTSALQSFIYTDTTSGIIYRMVYTGVTGASVYSLITCESTDLINWSNFNKIAEESSTSTDTDGIFVNRPAMTKVGSNYLVYYAGEGTGQPTRIHLISSTSPTSGYIKRGVCIGYGSSGDLDESKTDSPKPLFENNVLKMFYQGQNVGSPSVRALYAISEDGGFTFSKQGLHIDIGASTTYNDNGVYEPFVLSDGTTYHMWNMGDDGSGAYTIGYTSSTIVAGISKKPYGSLTNTDPLPSFEVVHGNLTMSGQEEIARIFHWREFGNGDKNGASSTGFDTLTTGPGSNRAFVLDDGLTGLVGALVSDSSGDLGFDVAVTDYIIFTFIGTGIAINYNHEQSDTTWSIDGVNVKSFKAYDINQDKVVVLASNLYYGLHVVKARITIATNGTAIKDFIIFQPKQPEIPEGAVLLSDRMINADFVAQTGADILKHSKGIVRNDSSRGIKYDGTGPSTLMFESPNGIGGLEVRGLATTDTEFTYPFFGAGVCVRWESGTNRAGSVTFSLSNDGGVNFYPVSTSGLVSLNAGNPITYGSNGGVNSINGIFNMFEASQTYGHFTGIDKLNLDNYIVKISATGEAGKYVYISAIDVTTPIHRSNHYSKTLAHNPFYDELCSGGSGISNADLIVGPDGWTLDEVRRNKKNEIEAYWNIWEPSSYTTQGLRKRFIRGSLTNGVVNAKQKNVSIWYGTTAAYDATHVTIQISGYYDISWRERCDLSVVMYLMMIPSGFTTATRISYANEGATGTGENRIENIYLASGTQLFGYTSGTVLKNANYDYNRFEGILRKAC